MEEDEAPSLLAALICEEITPTSDVTHDILGVRNIFEMPVTGDWVGSNLTVALLFFLPVPGKFRLRLALRNPDGKRVMMVANEILFEPTTRGVTARAPSLRSVRIPAPGEYALDLLQGESVLASLPLVLVPPGTLTAKTGH